jgi:hypothetical protein
MWHLTRDTPPRALSTGRLVEYNGRVGTPSEIKELMAQEQSALLQAAPPTQPDWQQDLDAIRDLAAAEVQRERAKGGVVGGVRDAAAALSAGRRAGLASLAPHVAAADASLSAEAEPASLAYAADAEPGDGDAAAWRAHF